MDLLSFDSVGVIILIVFFCLNIISVGHQFAVFLFGNSRSSVDILMIICGFTCLFLRNVPIFKSPFEGNVYAF